MLRYKYLQFLEKLTELKPEKKYHTKDRMDKIAFSSVQKKIETCCNQGQLLDLVMNGKTDIPEYKYLYFGSAEKIRSRALQMITNQEDLFLIATNKKGETALAAISRISDPDLLVRIALAPEKNAYDKVREVSPGCMTWTNCSILLNALQTVLLSSMQKGGSERKTASCCATTAMIGFI